MNPIVFVMFCLAFIPFLSSCTGVTSTNEMSTQPVSAITATITSLPAPTMTPLPTHSIPTPTDLELEILFNSLQDEVCQLPCYLGVTPGETKFVEASQILENMGATNYGTREYPYQNETMYEYYYSLDVDTPTGSILQRIKLYVYNDNIFRIKVDIGSPLEPLFYEYWSRYTIPSIFEKHGIPDVVHIAKDTKRGNDVWVTYNAAGIDLGNMGLFSEDGLFCPGLRNDATNTVYMTLFDPNQHGILAASSQFEESVLVFQNGALEKKTQSIVPIETAIGISIEQFYKQILADPEICFERIDIDQ